MGKSNPSIEIWNTRWANRLTLIIREFLCVES